MELFTKLIKCTHTISLLMKVVQNSRKLLPVGSYTGRLVSQMVNRIALVQPLGVTVMNERDVIVELREEDAVGEVSQLMPGLTSWKGHSLM